jgi:hypothetical protein
MRKITTYETAYGKSLHELDLCVQAMITKGWQPFGSLCDSKLFWVQPMVKYKAPDDPLEGAI